MDFNLSPLLIVWEATQACDRTCVHCRPAQRRERDPGELTAQEGFSMLDEAKQFGNPLMVFTAAIC
jgi:MoaA/NifB/PqqE/SkfB family radical SAM enzyme